MVSETSSCFISVFNATTNVTTTVYVDSGAEYFGLERHVWAFIVAGAFAAMAIIWSMIGVASHYYHNHDEHVRANIIRLHLMVPIYAACSWLSLYFKEQTLYFTVVRATYEAVCIYAFYQFLVAYLGGEAHTIHKLASKTEAEQQRKHVAPCSWCMDDWPMGPQYFFKTKQGCLQYIVIQVICAIATFVCRLVPTGRYLPDGEHAYYFTDGNWSWTDSYGYITFVQNCSQIWAMYCLVMLYMATSEDLQATNPVPKFATVKAVVFMTFWQGVILAGMVKLNVLHSTCTYSTEQESDGLQNFIICIEMFLAAWAHWKYFSYEEFKTNVVSDFDANDQKIGPSAQIGSPRVQVDSGVSPASVELKEEPHTKLVPADATPVHSFHDISI